MVAAYRGVVENEQSMRKMSNLYNVETLGRKVNRSLHSVSSQDLLPFEEDLLCKYIIELEDMVRTKEDVQQLFLVENGP